MDQFIKRLTDHLSSSKKGYATIIEILLIVFAISLTVFKPEYAIVIVALLVVYRMIDKLPEH